MNKQQARLRLQVRQDTSRVLPATECAQLDGASVPKPFSQPRRENTPARGGRMSATHSVFVLSQDWKPLAPTTPAKARKLLKAGVARKVWSKFGTFGIQLLTTSRQETPLTTAGVDHGTKYEGYAVICGGENVLSVKLDLPDKKQIVRKLEERRTLRRARRHNTCRRRPARFDNRTRLSNWLAPGQAVIVGSRLKVLGELFRYYPITVVGMEDVRFNHARHRWGQNFSTVEIGKARIRQFILAQGAQPYNFAGYDTKELREQYGYRKTKDKAADRFEAHCSDALALAVEVGPKQRVEPGRFVVVDDTYRSVRRKLHDTQPAPGGIRAPYSRGTVFGLRKGLLIGAINGKRGRLCGEYRGSYRYYDQHGKRQMTRRVAWVSAQFIRRHANSPAD